MSLKIFQVLLLLRIKIQEKPQAMNKEEIQKKNLVIETLKNGSDEKVLSILLELKEQGDLFYIDTLLDLLTSNRAEIVKKGVLDFISDIKTQEVVPIIASYVKRQANSLDISHVITASWQSRLDFSKYIEPFVHHLIHSNYKTAFEAFTVIENNAEALSSEEIGILIDTIKKGLPKVDRDKQLLLLEMVSVLDKIRRAAQ
jgi:hypothetical protein